MTRTDRIRRARLAIVRAYEARERGDLDIARGWLDAARNWLWWASRGAL